MALALAVGSVTALLTVGPVAAVQPDAATGDDARLAADLRTVALGVSRWNGTNMADLDAYIASVGGTAPATWTIWSNWGEDKTKAFPMTAATGAGSLGAAPMIWWQPVTPSDPIDCTYVSYANIAAGEHDAYISDFARDAKRYEKTLLLRFAPEVNGSYHPWGVGKCGNDATSFLAAWRHVHDIFRAVGAKNVRFVWSVAKQECPGGCNAYAPFYPGDDYVDYMAFSSFNWGAQRDNWVSMYEGFRWVTQRLAEISDRPIIAVETGCNPDGSGVKEDWISAGYPEVYEKLPAIVAIVYLDVDLRGADQPDWRLVSPPEAMAAYAEVVAQKEFQGMIPGR